MFDRKFKILRSEALNKYKDYCDLYGLDPENDRNFTKQLKDMPKVKSGKIGNDRAWVGITFRSVNEDGAESTDSTDSTHAVFFQTFNAQKNEKEENSVRSVQSVPSRDSGEPSGKDFEETPVQPEKAETTASASTTVVGSCSEPVGVREPERELTPNIERVLDAASERMAEGVKRSAEGENEVNIPAQLICYFCLKPLMENDWTTPEDGFTEGKPAHNKCVEFHRASLADNNREYGNPDDNPKGEGS